MSCVLIHDGRCLGVDLDTQADVRIQDGRIAAIGHDLGAADVHIDAAGCYVLPGGVDPHVHLEYPSLSTMTSDSVHTGTVAAAHGGTTTVINFALPEPGESLSSALDRGIAKSDGNAAVDYSYHVVVRELREGTLGEVDLIAGRGVTSLKLFMAYPGELMIDDAALFEVMERCGTTGVLPMVHAENGTVIDLLVRRALAAGRRSAGWHGQTRPIELEAEAIHRAIVLAGLAGSAVYFVHVSGREPLAEISRARSGGQPVFAETCPHYLFLDKSVYDRPSFEPAPFVLTPPLRAKDHQAQLWRGIRSGDLQTVSTDHCPFCLIGQKDAGIGDFSKIPNGAPGIEHRLPLLYGRGVLAGHLSLADLVAVTATGPARIFGLYPRKGTLQPGADADIVIFDPGATTVISAATAHMRVDHSLYEGWTCAGAVRTVLLGGEPVVLDAATADRTPAGRYLARDPVHPRKPGAAARVNLTADNGSRASS